MLLVSLAGIVLLTVWNFVQQGFTFHTGLGTALLAALSAATGMLIYQERRSWALLRELRAALARIEPTYAKVTTRANPGSGTEALEREIRTLTERWQDFCEHCQRVHDAEMVQAGHLATMGELAAGIAHEIRNPLAGIAGAIEIIAKDFAKEHPDREILGDLKQEVRRIEKVLNDLLVYARPKPPQFGRTDLKATIARTLQLARQQTGPKKIEFSIQIPPALPHFRGDSEQLEQVLLNLVLNAIQAIAQEGKVTVAASLVNAGDSVQSDCLQIAVSDTGSGIPPEHLERVFRPFYTTKRGGTGLGLSLCRRIVSQHGGTLAVESKVGEGSRFVIRLPLREADEEQPKEIHVH